MFKESLELLKAAFIKLIQSRLFAVGIALTALFCVLTAKLIDLQIVNGDKYNADFIESIERTVRTPGARGNIYDADGNLLAYNKLSYNVIIADDGAYSGDYNRRNLMLLRLSGILEKYGVNIISRFDVDIDENGDFYYTSSSESARRRFVANVYGVSSSRLDDEEGRYPSNVTAYELFLRKVKDYAFDKIRDEYGAAMVLSDREMLDMVKILFTMRQTAFKRYETTTIAQSIDENCVAELLENASELRGVSVQESYIRRYNNARYFSHIIGYTGAVQDEKQLTELRKINENYEITDVVGATGIEKTMEAVLQGTKGVRNMYVDSHGQILEVISETEPRAGDNVYLTISQNLQIGIYHLLEQELASIIANKLVPESVNEIEPAAKASDIVISVDDAYYQLINNNILNVPHFTAEDAGDAEQRIARAFTLHKREVMSMLRRELTNPDAKVMSELSNEYVAYMVYIYDYLSNRNTGIIDTGRVNQESESYKAWKNDTTSLRDYLYAGISEGFINVGAVKGFALSAYQDADSIYDRIVDMVLQELDTSDSYRNLIYKYMIISRSELPGKWLCMALFEQGVLEMDEEQYEGLRDGDAEIAFQFLRERILDIDITPAQLALDPCMGSVVVTDVNTGAVRALVTYPGYDNNRINESAYFSRCLTDLSLPLINSATQTNKAPGSTFKPLTAVAVLEEKKISAYDRVDCTGVYREVTPNIRCWNYAPGHGPLTVAQAIENSCNYSFATYGHLLSTSRDPQTGEEVYSTITGIDAIRKYAEMFGLDRVSGVEIEEKEPRISDSDPERSAFGQGTHSFNNVQLARYTVALANRGKLFDLTLLKQQTDADGNIREVFQPKQIGSVDIADSTWNVVHQGLRSIVTTGVARNVFQGFHTVEVAGKTGTAEEIKTRGNHGFFISYAPYNDPEIAVNVTIPFSYSSGNSAMLAKSVYGYYYGQRDLSSIIAGDARSIGLVNVVDG